MLCIADVSVLSVSSNKAYGMGRIAEMDVWRGIFLVAYEEITANRYNGNGERAQKGRQAIRK